MQSTERTYVLKAKNEVRCDRSSFLPPHATAAVVHPVLLVSPLLQGEKAMWVTKLSTAIEGSTGAADTVAGASLDSTRLSRERQLPARNPLPCLLMRHA